MMWLGGVANFIAFSYGLAVCSLAMKYEFDPAKDAKNTIERSLSLALAPYVFEGLVHVVDDDRKDYGERRQVAYGLILGRLFVCVFTDRGETRRVISLRKANSREVEAYAPKDHA